MTKHILIVSSELFSLINFRSSLIKHLVKKGHKVTALYPKEKNDIENLTQELRDIGVIFKSY